MGSDTPRSIVVCLDGTENSPIKHDTSVVRIFRLARAWGDRNVAYYDPGVGTLPRPGRLSLLLSKMGRKFGSTSGHGMVENIGEAYEFVCESYRDGDKL